MEAPTERILAAALEWITTPAAELHSLVDTQPIPVVDVEAEKKHAADIAFSRPKPGTAPSEGSATWKPPLTYEELARVLQGLRQKWKM
ncbi:hypothetical protein [Prauserella flavalba]|uniref:hypothetical protein n=1 Tax=Prauserella flavalba TaxID=1477506 RepID=UPI0036E41228